MKGKEVVPPRRIKGLTFFPVPEFDDVQLAFGAHEKSFFNRHDLPEIPGKYEGMASSLFFKGGDITELHQNVDREKARRALRAWLYSWSPAHEAKVATVAYALWLWTHETALDGGANETI